MSEANSKFVNAFVDMNISDASQYMTTSGQYTDELGRRIENALFMYIMGNDKKAMIALSQWKEAGDTPVKSLLQGFVNSIKVIVKLNE